MRQLLYQFNRPNGIDPEILVEVYWDLSNSLISADFDGVTAFTGPSDGNPDALITYKFCQGTTLNTFVGILDFPYAQKVETPDSPFCAVQVCDLAVVLPVATTKASTPTASDGTATISYTGSVSAPENVRYSLDNSITGAWQPSNVFTGLAPGTYTVYIRDEDPALAPSQWCRAQANFTVEYNIVYSSKYHLNFDDLDGRLYNLSIFKKDYTGTSEPVCGGGSPVTLEYQEGEKYDIIKSTKASVSLLSDVRFKYLDFFSSDEREHRVDLSRDGALIWRGYLLPDVYNEPFISPNYFVSITASDGLNTLKNYPYQDDAGNLYTGEKSLLDVIFDCLGKLDLALPLRSVVDVYEANMREATDTADTDPVVSDPLFQAMVNTSNFLDKKGLPLSCEKVLEYCLGFLGARIFQAEGRWNVECIDAKRGSYWAVNYNPDRTFSSYQIIDPIRETSPPYEGELFWIEGDQQLEIQPAWKTTKVHTDLQPAPTLVPDGDFKESAWFTGGAVLNKWTATALIDKEVVSQRDGTTAVNIVNGAGTFGTADYIQSEPFNIVAVAGEKLHLKIKYKYSANSGAGITPTLIFQLTGGGYTLTDTDGWVPTTSDAKYTIIADQPNSAVEWEAVMPGVPVTADYTLTVYELINGSTSELNIVNLLIYNLGVHILPEGVLPLEGQEAEVTNPAKYSYKPDAMEVYFTDTQQSLNFKNIHKNHVTVDGVQSSSWHVKGSTNNNGILPLLAANVAYNYSRPTHVLRGSLRGLISYADTIREKYDFGRLFMFNGLSVDIRRAAYAGTFYELITELVLNPGEVTDGILTEASDILLLETGDYLLQE